MAENLVAVYIYIYITLRLTQEKYSLSQFNIKLTWQNTVRSFGVLWG